MIEIIQEESWNNSQDRSGLPKNIKQIGTPDTGDRIYIENTAYQKMHPAGQSAEKMVYVMLGRFDDFAGHTCIFVEDVVKMNEVEFNGKLPVWNDDSWGYLYRKIQPKHENMIIVGWAIDICGQLPGMTAQLERIHQNYFGGIHQILLLMDTLEQEEVFFSNRNGYLKRREGFYIYYDKGIPGKMEAAMENLRSEVHKPEKNYLFEDEQKTVGKERYRDYLNKRRGDRRMPTPVHNSSYTSTLLLAAVILVLGYSAYQNHEKMESMERTLSQMELQAAMQTEVVQENAVRVEDVIGNITPEANDKSTQSSSELQNTSLETNVQITQQDTQGASTQLPAGQEEENNVQVTDEQVTQTLSESEIYLSQGYYVVQAGDNLAGICRKIYHTTAMLDKLCEINDIDNADAIFAGQRLILPD